MTASQRLLVPVGNGVHEVEDLAGQRVCTSRGSTTEGALRALPVQLDVLTLRGIPDCVVELQRGEVAAVSSDDVILAGLAVQDPQTEVVGRALDQAAYGVGMRLDQPDLVRFVNGLLERLREDGSLAASNKRWLGGMLDPVPQPPARPLPRLILRRIGGRVSRGAGEGDRGPGADPDDGPVGERDRGVRPDRAVLDGERGAVAGAQVDEVPALGAGDEERVRGGHGGVQLGEVDVGGGATGAAASADRHPVAGQHVAALRGIAGGTPAWPRRPR